MRTTYIGRHGEVRVSADQGTHRVTIGVSGREVTMTAENAVAVVEKIKEAVRCSRIPDPHDLDIA